MLYCDRQRAVAAVPHEAGGRPEAVSLMHMYTPSPYPRARKRKLKRNDRRRKN